VGVERIFIIVYFHEYFGGIDSERKKNLDPIQQLFLQTFWYKAVIAVEW
jgi:hypothetical protein